MGDGRWKMEDGMKWDEIEVTNGSTLLSSFDGNFPCSLSKSNPKSYVELPENPSSLRNLNTNRKFIRVALSFYLTPDSFLFPFFFFLF